MPRETAVLKGPVRELLAEEFVDTQLSVDDALVEKASAAALSAIRAVAVNRKVKFSSS